MDMLIVSDPFPRWGGGVTMDDLCLHSDLKHFVCVCVSGSSGQISCCKSQQC